MIRMSSGDVLALLGIIFGSQALWNFLQSLFQKKKPWQELLIGLGHDRITLLCEQEIKTGYTTPYRFHNIVEIYEPYKKAGGDGDAEMMFNKVKSLPMKSDEFKEAENEQ